MKTLLVGAVVASLLVAAVVTVVSATRTPTYEATAVLMVGQEEELSDGAGLIPLAAPPETIQQLTATMLVVIESPPVAEGTIRRLGLRVSQGELLNNLTAQQVETSQFIRLSYTDTDPARAKEVVNAVGRESSEVLSAAATADGMTAVVYEKASVPDAPASPKPLRNGVLTLVVGLALCAGTALARTAGRARAAGTLGERPSRLAKLVGQAGVLGGRHSAPSIFERVKEKKLLRALGRRGKLTAVEAALETSLTVEDATRILFELAHNGHLKVTVEPGRLLYSFWEHDAP